MSIKNTVKNINVKYNPFGLIKRNKMRKSPINQNITFLCPNCMGDILFHDLYLQFRSSTINLMMYQTDFAKFVLDIDYYMSCEKTD